MNTETIKISEERFISRFRSNIQAYSQSVLTEDTRISDIRRLVNYKKLYKEMEAKYPLARSLSVRIAEKTRFFAKTSQAIVLKAKVIIRLERIIEAGLDDDPISLTELNKLLAEENDLASRSLNECAIGLFSPTGWTEQAANYIANEPTGTGWISQTLHPILIGPVASELLWDVNNQVLHKYIECFCGLTVQERKKVCREKIDRAIIVREFANLTELAVQTNISFEIVRQVAKEMSRVNNQLTLKKVSGVGLVLKKKI